ncbi:MAG: tyrosine-type recombinase/integrase [Phycisphaera sp.]|nr:tyrosine-type recombinase/integrase [Phycisphaera sp.]
MQEIDDLDDQPQEAIVVSTTNERHRIGDRVAIYRDLKKSPHWYVAYSLDGHQFRYSLKTKSKKRAVTLAKQKDAELVLGLAEPPSHRGPVIANVIKQYLTYLERKERGLKTQRVYRGELNDFSAFVATKGIKRLDHVTAEMLEEYQHVLKTQGLGKIRPVKRVRRRPCKPRTLRNKLKAVRQMMRWALKRDILKKDPAKSYELPPKVKTKAYCWTSKELRLLRQHTEAPYLDIFDFLRLTGLRNDEVCALTKDDVNFDEGFIEIRAKVCPQTGRRWKPKHGNERTVPLCPEALAIARRVYDNSPGPWLFWAPNTRSDQRGRFNTHRLWAALRRIKKKADIKEGTVHTFRHVFCSFMANSGVPMLQLMAIMGHGSLEIVTQYYHLTEQQLLKALDNVPFEQMLDDPADKDKENQNEDPEKNAA